MKPRDDGWDYLSRVMDEGLTDIVIRLEREFGRKALEKFAKRAKDILDNPKSYKR